MDEPAPEPAAIDLSAVNAEDLAKVISGWLRPAPPDAGESATPKD